MGRLLLATTVLAIGGVCATQALAASGEVGPAAIAIRHGTITGGNVASLQTEDLDFLDIQPGATKLGRYVFTLSARFDGVPNEATWLWLWQTGTADPGSAYCVDFALSEVTGKYRTVGGSLFDSFYRRAGGIMGEPFNQWVSGDSGLGSIQLRFKCKAKPPFRIHLDRLTFAWNS
jgi:hypothetical protein